MEATDFNEKCRYINKETTHNKMISFNKIIEFKKLMCIFIQIEYKWENEIKRLLTFKEIERWAIISRNTSFYMQTLTRIESITTYYIWTLVISNRNYDFHFAIQIYKDYDIQKYNFACYLCTCTVQFYYFYYNQQMQMNTIKVYITTVSLWNLYSHVFRHFHVFIREFTTNALLS